MKKGIQNLYMLYWLKKASTKNGKSAIYLRITINQKRVELSTNLHVFPQAWDAEGQFVKGKTEEVKTLNQRLAHIKVELHKKYLQLEALGKPITAETLKNQYLGVNENQKSLSEVMDFYHSRFAEKVTSAQKSKSSLKCIHTAREKVKLFLKHQFKRTDMQLREIKPSFAGDFEHFLMTHEKGCSNIAMKYIRIFKRILKFAVDQGWLASHPLDNFKCTYKEPPRERLTMDEVVTIYTKEFDIDRLTEVRDVFIFSCYTGFAYQDVFSLTADDIITGIDGDKWIVKNRAKTNTPERVPLLPIALDILNKYQHHPWCIDKNRLLPVNSNQCYNGYLKEIARLSGI